LETPKNLLKAYIGESVAISRYVIYSQIAKDEQYVFVGRVFLEVAENEKSHAEILSRFLKRIKVEPAEVEIKAPITFGDTVQNLMSAVEGERFEADEMYPKLAEVAEEEGFVDVAKKLRTLADVEKRHEEKFDRLLKEMKAGTMFKREEAVDWVCLVCGYVHHGNAPPEVCPNCGAKFYNFVAKDLMEVVL